eukprot:gnl/MRDRNA2_/MRDRNA2_200739_c0_seq1.p1 gnl/MRDRNA2_/MRDRNA2_200739_c0~~gnl/MRDRNA2_/MRDRNA2_200739_c0_seq1.p1  ORF type:complete len:757 (-),score=103.74 gnl/MRDRNA2_/MRDRNA2_200739_c0_seq1:2-2179(-)
MPQLFGSNLIIVLAASLWGLQTKSKVTAERMASSIQSLDLHQLARQHTETVAARIAIARINNLLNAKTSYRQLIKELFKQVQSAVTGRTYHSQGRVLEALNDCCNSGPGDLLYVLSSGDVDLPQFLGVAGTSDVLELFTRYASDMDVVTKARMVDALQRQPDFIFLTHQQKAVVEILKNCHGEELTTLKNLLDEGGDFHNLHKLVFHDLSRDLREIALVHIKAEGIRSLQSSGTQASCKILSDVDDTLYSSGGHFPAGADKRFPKGAVYPGVLSLFRELDQGVGDENSSESRSARCASMESIESAQTSKRHRLRQTMHNLFGHSSKLANPVWLRVSATEWREVSMSPLDSIGSLKERLEALRLGAPASQHAISQMPGRGDVSFSPPAARVMSNLVFLSARPHAYKDYAESKSYRLFHRLRERGQLHCMPTLLAGRLRSSAGATLEGAIMELRMSESKTLKLLLCASLPALFLGVYFNSALSMSNTVVIVGIIFIFVYGFIATCRYTQASDVWRAVGEDKVRNFMEYRGLYSECSTVFFGDNGQGDLLCGEKLSKMGQCPFSTEKNGKSESQNESHALPCVSAVFIHEVIPRSQQLTSVRPGVTEEEQLDEWAELNVYFHKTYIGAAINAFHCRLISLKGVARVGNDAVEDLVRMRSDFFEHDHSWDVLVDELNKDVEKANAFLPEDLRITPVPSSTALHMSKLKEKNSSFYEFSFMSQAPGSPLK